MRKSALFFGSLIVLVGAILLALNLGLVTNKIWTFFWPVIIILLGAWFIARPMLYKGKIEIVSRSIPLDGAEDASIQFNYGAGIMTVSSSRNPLELVGGTFSGGLSEEVNRVGNSVAVKLNPPNGEMFMGTWVTGNQRIDWSVGLTKEIPLKLFFHTGACESKIDLTDLLVKELTVETGASSTEVHLPSNAKYTKVSVKSGVASVKLFVPQGVAATIKESSGLSGIKVDTNRFVQNGHTYESTDYLTSNNKVDISYEGGVGSIEIY